jgi:hypothetical protein
VRGEHAHRKGWLNKPPPHKGREQGCPNGHRRYPEIIVLLLISLSTVQAQIQENDVSPDNDLAAEMTLANSINNANPSTATDAGNPSANNASRYPDISKGKAQDLSQVIVQDLKISGI